VELDKDEEGLLTQMTYLGHTMKTVVSGINEEAVHIIDTSGLTDTKYITTISSLIHARLERTGRLGPFLVALQLINVMIVDSRYADEE